MPSLYSYGFSRRTLTGLIGINPGDNVVLACRQVAAVVSALGKASHILSIDGHGKTETAPKIWDPVYEHMTGIRRYWPGPWTSCAPGEDQAGTSQTDDVND